MQLNNHHQHWLNKRGVSDAVIELFNLSTYNHPQIGDCIKIPYTSTHSKYRRDPLDDRKPKYLYDQGGKVTLFGADKLQPHHTSVVITEGELDALVLWSLNIPAVSSTGGAMSWQDEWKDYFTGRRIFLCFDNDDAGAEGMVKAEKALRGTAYLGTERTPVPANPKVIFIPEQPDVKDITDFVSRGGDFHSLMATAKSYPDITAVEADKALRKAQWLPTRFHNKYLDHYRQEHERANRPTPNRQDISDAVLRAKAYPMDNLIEFRQKKSCCPWHNEKTPSLAYYPKTNSAYCFGSCGKAYDSIDAYMVKHPGTSFVEAVKALNQMV